MKFYKKKLSFFNAIFFKAATKHVTILFWKININLMLIIEPKKINAKLLLPCAFGVFQSTGRQSFLFYLCKMSAQIYSRYNFWLGFTKSDVLRLLMTRKRSADIL